MATGKLNSWFKALFSGWYKWIGSRADKGEFNENVRLFRAHLKAHKALLATPKRRGKRKTNRK